MNPFRSIRQAPITVCVIWAACTLFVGVYFDTTQEPGSRLEVQSRWGAGLMRGLYVAETSNSEFEQVAGFQGPIQVWNGEWWRLLVNNLHHGGLLHLLLNGCAMIYLGRILERRMSHVAYLTLLAGAAFCIAAVTGLLGELGIGLSGVVYAQVGLLMVWRDRDESVAQEFSLRMVLFAGMWLLFCQMITYTGIIAIGNAAHYTGLIYGWIWGQVYLEQRQRGMFRFLFGVSHLLLYPAFWFILNPFWNGSWHLYLSQERELARSEMREKFDNSDRSSIVTPDRIENGSEWLRRKVERLQTAVLLEPTIEFGWLQLSGIYESTADRRLALRTTLEGLKHNRSSEKLLNRAVDLWVDDERLTKDSNIPVIVHQVFGAEADAWQEKLSRRVAPVRNRLSWQPDQLSRLLEEPRLSSLSQFLNPFTETQPIVPRFDPSWPDSALGRSVL